MGTSQEVKVGNHNQRAQFVSKYLWNLRLSIRIQPYYYLKEITKVVTVTFSTKSCLLLWKNNDNNNNKKKKKKKKKKNNNDNNKY